MQTESKRFTFFLASIAALTSLSIDMSLPGVPAIEHEFHLASGRGGLTLSWFLAGYAVSPLVGGPLADRFGRRLVLLVSLVLFAISALACSISSSFTMLLAVRLLQGCAAGVSTMLPLAIVRDVLDGYAARQRISEVTIINNIMPIIAPVFGSSFMLLGSWRVLFGVQAIFAFCVILVLLFGFSESLPVERRQCLHPVDVIRNYMLLLGNRVFLGFALVYALTFACMFSFVSASPLILMQRMNVERSAYTLLFALIATGTILGATGSAVLSRWHASVRDVVTAGLTLMSAASVVAAALQVAGLHRPIDILPLVFLTFFGFGVTGPAVTLGALGPLPHLAGSGSGALRSILMVFGSGTSGFLAVFCARHFLRAELATTLMMSASALAALLLYLSQLRGPPLLPGAEL